MSMQSIFSEIHEERIKQDEQWGGAEHDDQHVIGQWTGYIDRQLNLATVSDMRARLIKVAALAVAAIESFDRKGATT